MSEDVLHFETCGEYWKWKYQKDYKEFRNFLERHLDHGMCKMVFIEEVYDEIKKDPNYKKALDAPIPEDYTLWSIYGQVKKYANHLLTTYVLEFP